jgi:hypothetical protein
VNRLHPRIQALWVLRALLASAVFGAIAFGASRFLPFVPTLAAPAVFGAFALLLVSLAVARYRLWGYEIRDDSIYLERGVFTRVRTVVPFVRIQHVDSARGPLERLTGLASTVVYTAGSRGADVTIPGLTPDGSEDLQERLKRLAIRAEGEDAV